MLPTQRLESLRVKHQNISHLLEKEEQRPAADDYYIQQLKKQKLHLKDLMEGINENVSSDDRMVS